MVGENGNGKVEKKLIQESWQVALGPRECCGAGDLDVLKQTEQL